MKGVVRGLTVCVGFDDLMAITLPLNMRHLTECVVVTSHEDERTQQLVSGIPNARLHVTDAFTRNGARFNKGAAIEEAFDALGRSGWIWLWDADILLPDSVEGDPSHGFLHGARRRILEDATAWSPTLDWSTASQTREFTIPGYFQLFHADDPALRSRPWYATDYAHAGIVDQVFANRWPVELHAWMPYEVLHLGPRDTNWMGRASPRVDGLPNPQAAENLERLDAWYSSRGWHPLYREHDRSAIRRVGFVPDKISFDSAETPSNFG